MKLKALGERNDLIAGPSPELVQLALRILDDFGRGQHARRKARGHVQRPVHEVAEIVRQLAVVADEELLDGELAVLADIHLAD